MANMHQLLKAMIEKGASDLHITTGSPPQLRIDGKLCPLKTPPLSPQETKQLCYSVLTDAQKHRFEETNELDLSFSVQKLSRFRGNIFVQRGNTAGAFRAIPFKIMTFEELKLPKIVAELAKKPRGLVLVTGPTGSGKSTTLASVVDFPEPVGPVTRIRPRGFLDRSVTMGGRLSSSKVMILKGMARNAPATFPRCTKMFPRNRESFWTLNDRSSSFVSSKRCFWASVRTE